MANIFAILTAVVLAISAFFAYQNMGDENTPGRGYKGWVKKRTDEESSLARKQTELSQTQGVLKDTSTKLAGVNEDNTRLEGEVDAQLTKNEALEAQVNAKEAEASAKKADADKKEDEIKQFGDVDEVIANLKKIQSDLEQIDRDILEREAMQASLEAERSTLDGSIADVTGKIQLRVRGQSDPNLRTRVSTVYRNLGFVTLAGGDNIGIVKDSQLDVVRDGEVIGKLQVTTVEASTSAADVIPDSFPDGVGVRSGDVVTAPQPDQPAAEGGATGTTILAE